MQSTRMWRRVARQWHIARSCLVWGGRLHRLGDRSVMHRPLLIRNPRCLSVGDRVTIERQSVFADLAPGRGPYPKISIGDGCTILYRFQCNAAERVAIGRDVLIASNVLITDSDHVVEPDGVPVTRNSQLITRPVAVGDNCWIGQNVVVLKGVTIGSNSIIGANSVVNRDVPACSVAAGNPARVIKTLRRPAPQDERLSTVPAGMLLGS